jgi:hypothetical protein
MTTTTKPTITFDIDRAGHKTWYIGANAIFQNAWSVWTVEGADGHDTACKDARSAFALAAGTITREEAIVPHVSTGSFGIYI